MQQNESVRRMIDLALLRRQVEAFPPPERLREEMRGGDNPAPGRSDVCRVTHACGGGISRTAQRPSVGKRRIAYVLNRMGEKNKTLT